MQVLQHVPFEGPGAVAGWAQSRGHTLEVRDLSQGAALPGADAFDLLVMMGGPMSVNEEDTYAWLRPEKALVREALAAGKKVLGICLGGQMIASALGAAITRNPVKEIGWFPVEATAAGAAHPFWAGLPRALPVFHWHGETFALPAGATHLLRSAACEHQAFAVGTQVLALQCHLEVTEQSLTDMAAHGRGEIDVTQPFIQSHPAMLGQPEMLDKVRPWAERLLDNFVRA